MVEASQRQRGYARPAFAAKDGTVLGGNLSTMEVAPDIGLGNGEVLVVETDGDIPIIHLRRDIEAGTEAATLLAAEDNQSALVSIDFDPERLAEEIAQGVDFGGVFTEGELSEMSHKTAEPIIPELNPAYDPKLEYDHLVNIYCSKEWLSDVQDIINDWAESSDVQIDIS
jgi:hypothetical protein